LENFGAIIWCHGENPGVSVSHHINKHPTALSQLHCARAEEQHMFHCLNHAAAKATKAAMPWNILPVVSLFVPHLLDSQWVLTDQETSQRLPVLRIDHEIQVVPQHHCDFSGSLVFQWLTSVVKEIETR
jgi:hypothetical protein